MENFKKNRYKDLKPYDAEEFQGYINLGANESFLNFSEELKDGLIKIIKNFSFNRYPSSDCLELRTAFSEYISISKDRILAGNGSDELIFLVMEAFLEKGDKVLTLDPDFVMYSQYANVLGVNNVKFESEKDFTLDEKDFFLAIEKEKPKMVILSNPNNPTGAIISKNVLIDLVKNYNLIVVIDEAYGEFYKDSMIPYINEFHNLIVLKTTSKSIGLAALRIGFLLGNEDVITEIKKIKAPYNINAMSQEIGTLVLKHKELLKKSTDEILREKNYLLSELKKLDKYLKINISHTNFFLVDFENAKEVYEYLLNNKIITRDFNGGRLLNSLRINVGSREENERLISCLKSYFKVK